MSQQKNGETNGGSRIPGISRRRALAIAGAGAAALGSASTVFGGDGHEAKTPGGGNETDTDTAQSQHFLADLVDPVFGYPLATEETDDVELEHLVNAIVEEGQGAHENFPQEPDENVPGGGVEIETEFLFDPVGLHVEPDDLVHFNMATGLHTVTAFHEKFGEPGFEVPTRVPNDVPGFTSPPLAPGESWVYQFSKTGVYDYLCLPHLGLGMVGRIVVLDPDEDDVETDEFAAPTQGELPPNVERVLNADELAPAHIVDSGSVAWSDLSLEE